MWLTSGLIEDRQAYVAARREMKQTVHLAKVQSWQKFCSEAGSLEEGSPRELARINKILQRNVNRTLGIMRRRNGEPASSPEESIEILLDEHFPDSIHADDQLDEDASGITIGDMYEWLSPEKICRAIRLFSPNKTAGLDDIKPITLQHLPPVVIDRLGLLYTASMELQYAPLLWRQSKAIFIPKAARKT